MLYRIRCYMELDPATPGMASFGSKWNNHGLTAITIARTGEPSRFDSVVVTSGNPAGRRIWFGGPNDSIGELILPTRVSLDDLLADLFVQTAGTPPTYGAFRWPDRVLPVDVIDPDVQPSFVVAHVCDHDAADPPPCVPIAQWQEGAA